jgi:serine/threonine protein kinase
MGNHPSAASKMLTDNGDIVDILTDRHLFRKTIPDDNEKRVARIIQAHPHPNIVNIYHVCDKYLDMEIVNTSSARYNTQDISRAHDYFLKHGIVYMDWKPDNYGTDLDGITKVFDFNSAALFDLQTGEWILKPPPYWAYSKAIEANMSTPLEIDTFTYEQRDAIWN